MNRLSILMVVVALGVADATAAAAQGSADHSLRWARGVMTESGSGFMTLLLRDRSLRIVVDPSTTFESATPGEKPAAGAVVEVHYSEKKDLRTAVWVFKVQATGSSDWSRKPGHSYWGVLQAAKKGSFELALGKKTRRVELDSHTRFVDTDGRIVAKGKKDVAPLLAGAQRVVVKYEEEDNSTSDGETFAPASSTKALEVRKLK